MQAFLSLCILCVAMFVGSFLAGLIPLMLSNIHSRQIKWFSAFGAGMLLCTSTQIIIPEAFSCGHDTNPTPETDQKIVVQTNDSSHWYYGTIFTVGFLFMFAIDNISKAVSTARFRNHWVTTLGLCIHAAADGLVVAVAALGEDTTFRYIVFLVMAIHKAPAAFGLVSFLVEQDSMLVSVIKRHLLVFSMSSPISALICYFIFQNISTAGYKVLGTKLPLLFSAGTFLYISTTHVIPELHHRETEEASSSHVLSVVQIVFFLLGCIIPFIVSLIHTHN